MSQTPIPDGNILQAIDETGLTLEQIAARLGFPDTAGRLRVVVDSITGALTLATVTTVGTVTTVTTVATVTSLTNMASVGSLFANYDQVAAWNAAPSANRGRITVA